MGRTWNSILFVLLLKSIPAAELGGRVVSGQKPIPGATVTAFLDNQKIATTTDEAGAYSFPDLGKGKWRLTVEMFGFVPAVREVTIAAATAADFDLTLENAAAEAPRTAAPAGFQVITANEEAVAPAKIEREVETAAPVDTADAIPVSDANEAFLVNGSLSRGLQAAEQEDFFDQMDAEMRPAKKKQKGPKGESSGMGKRAKKAAKRARKRSKSSNITSFGATKKDSEIRGTLFYGWRNSELDGRPYSLSGQPIPKAGYAQSRFGVALGGPLNLPRLIHSSQTFFFVSYTGTRSRNPYSNVDTVPTSDERAGDFSKPSATGPLVLYDPVSHLPLAGNLIPAFRLDSAARQLLQYIPLANLAGTVQNYQIVTAVPQNGNDLSVKLNHNLSDSNRLSLNFNLQSRNARQVQLFGFQDQLDSLGWQADLGWSHNFSPRAINSIHFAFSRNRSNYLPYFANGPDVAASIGIKGTSSDPINFGPPNLNFTNFGDMADGSPLRRRDQTAALRDGVTVVRGPHNLTFGGEFRRVQVNPITDSNGRGSFIFSGLLTSQFDSLDRPVNGSGFDFADFLFGFPHSGKIRFGSSSNYFRSSAYSAYVVDDWHARPNLTINAGLRHEYFSPYAEKYDRMSNLDFASGLTAAAAVTPGQTGAYTGVFPRALIDSDPKNLSPRLAIAWRPMPKSHLMVRAGYSIFYNGAIYADLPGRLASQPPFGQTTTLLASVEFPLRIATGFTHGNTKAINNSFAIDRGYKDGYAQTWNLSVQQNVTPSLVVEVGYLGTKGARLDIQSLPNRAAPGSPLDAEDRRLIRDAVGFTYETSNGNSIFHAGQARISRRLKKGLSLNAIYTLEKSIDNVSTLGGGAVVVAQDARNLAAERGLSSFDQRHLLNAGFTAQSPIGRTGMQPGSALGHALARWQFAGTITASSGLPYTARVLGNLADASGSGNLGSSRADATGLPVSGGIGYFNAAAFALPPSGRYGNAGRNTIPGPSRFALNASLSRSFHVSERERLELRIDGANLTNTAIFTNFGTVLNALNFGRPTAALPMRSFKASLRYKF